MTKKTAVEQRLDDLCEKVDGWGERLERAIDKHVADDKETFTKHDGRLVELERVYWKFSGKAALIAFVLTLLASSVSAALVTRLLR